MPRYIFFLLGFFLLLQQTTASLHAQSLFDHTSFAQRIEEKEILLDSIQAELLLNELEQSALAETRRQIRQIRDAMFDIVDEVTPILQSLETDIADITPEQTLDQTTNDNASSTNEGAEQSATELVPESDAVAQRRKELQNEASQAQGVITQARALASKSTRLLEQIAATRRGQFINQLFERQSYAFSPQLWSDAFNIYKQQFAKLSNPFSSLEATQKNIIFLVCVIAVILLIIGYVFSRYQMTTHITLSEISPFSSVSLSMLPIIVSLGAGFMLFTQTLLSQGLLNDANIDFTQTVCALIAFIIISSLSIMRFRKAQIIRRSMCILALITISLFTIDALLLEGGHYVSTALELAVVQSYIVTTIFASVMLTCSLAILKRRGIGHFYFLPRWAFYFTTIMAMTILTLNVFGYAAFSRYIFERVVLCLAFMTGILMIRAMIRPTLIRIDQWIKKDSASNQSAEQENFVFFWLSFTVDFVLATISIPLLARIIGAEWYDIKEKLRQAFFGFEIGNMTISISHIGIGFLVFFAVLFVTHLLQRLLSNKILPKTKIDRALKGSITQVLGYIGLIIALLTGISSIGFDLTNLALIAGALSVGIGFGLQSIVSNFVSGLILLFERPIKVDDWIITNSGEGLVKKISVRATEIETFDRTSIIVPNSELISSSVRNWTHMDKMGRVVVSVGISYDSDPRQAVDILYNLAKEDDGILDTPDPNVHFKDFGDSALIFDLRFFIEDISQIFTAATRMRLKIWDAFKDAGIEISFPQRDLHIRSAPGLAQQLEGIFKHVSTPSTE